MKKRKLVFAITAITVFSAMMLTSNTKAQAAAKKTYTITPKSSPYKGKYKKAKDTIIPQQNSILRSALI